MQLQHSSHDGFVMAPRTWSLLQAARTVTVLTNSRRIPADILDSRIPDESEVFVVFNRHRFSIDDRRAANTLWVHRLDEASGEYFGDAAADGPACKGVHRLYVAGDVGAGPLPRSDASSLSYRADLPGLRDYPVGRRLLIPQRGVRRIVSPSTGFAVLALLEELQRRGAGFRLRAMGIGGEYNGWPGHDWAYERRCLHRSGIDFRTPEGLPDSWHRLLDAFPYDLVRVLGKIAKVA